MTQTRFNSYELALLYENFALSTAGASVQADSVADNDSSLDARSQFLAAHLVNDSSSPWRSATLVGGSTYTITWDLGAERWVDTVALGSSNILDGEVRASFYTIDPLGSARPAAVASTGYVDPVIKGTPADYTFKTFRWTLGPPKARMERLQSECRLCPVLHLTQPYRARYVQIEITALASGFNGLDTYYQIARPIIGLVFRPHRNMVQGWRQEPVDDSVVRDLPSGAPGGVARGVRRRVLFDLPYGTMDEGFGVVQKLQEETGRNRVVWAWSQPAKPAHYFAQSIVGRLSALPFTEHLRDDRPGTSGWSITEVF